MATKRPPKRRKNNSLVKISAVEHLFNDACMRRLGQIACLPGFADTKVFAEGVREAARIYARDAHEPNSNELLAEVAELHSAAERRQYVQVAEILTQLSGAARQLLDERSSLPSILATVPRVEALHDQGLQEPACATLVRLCRIGGSCGFRLKPAGYSDRKPAIVPN